MNVCNREPAKYLKITLTITATEKKVLRTIEIFPKCTPVLDLHMAFNLQHEYDYITKLRR
jgi:hypothetical protein